MKIALLVLLILFIVSFIASSITDSIQIKKYKDFERKFGVLHSVYLDLCYDQTIDKKELKRKIGYLLSYERLF